MNTNPYSIYDQLVSGLRLSAPNSCIVVKDAKTLKIKDVLSPTGNRLTQTEKREYLRNLKGNNHA